MHLYVLARGQHEWLRRWVHDLSARYYPYKMKGKPNAAIQLGVRPIQLFEIVFPEPSLKEVLGTVWPYGYMGNGLEKYQMIFRKILKLDKIPPSKDITKNTLFERKYIDCTGIGTRKDNIIDGEEQL